MKILILGGYGTFGGNLARLLAKEERLTLLIAGRSLQKARALCDSLPTGAQSSGVFFDRNANVEAQIKEINPDILVDAMGPYQVYGDDPYRVVKACLANNIDYMDLADGSGFVKGINQFDEEAKAKNIFVLSGVSTCPVLTTAVVRKLSKGLTKINTIKGGIAPSPYSGVGLNVVRAITAYAGKTITLIRNRKETKVHALTETRRYTIAPPGHTPLNHILFSLVDVPDLQVVPELWPEIDSIWFGAGPVPEILHRMLISLSWLVRFKLLPSLLPFASLFHFVLNIIRWGEHRGGMFVSIAGTHENGQSIERSWHLIAERGDGPFIPSMPTAAIILKILSGKHPSAGARAATGELEVEDYEPLFKVRSIYTGMRESTESDAPLYKRILGSASEALPPPIIAMHNCTAANGTADIETGNNPLAVLIRAVVGFPKAGKDIPVKVTFQQKDGGELWQRNFDGKLFSSLHSEGTGHFDRLLTEKFGPMTLAMALVVEEEKLKLVMRHWKVFGISLPLALAPNGEMYEAVKDGLFYFHVEIKHPLTGLIIKYEGKLVPSQ